jgi:uncharacterized membrane protein YfcA
MSLDVVALLLVAGLAGGIANAIAGGATLITFPAMLAAGLPPVVANASNAVAVTPGHLVAAFADWRKMPRLDARLTIAVTASIFGGGVGAVLLLVTPERLFTLLVPALIGLATLVFACSRAIQDGVARAFGARGGEHALARAVLLAPTAVYGGYFGAGLGVMLLAILSITGREDVRAANALKNLLATAVSMTTIAIFTVQGVVHWRETFVMLLGAIAGGFLGGRLVKVLPASLIRALVVTAGAAMTITYAWRYWLH